MFQKLKFGKKSIVTILIVLLAAPVVIGVFWRKYTSTFENLNPDYFFSAAGLCFGRNDANNCYNDLAESLLKKFSLGEVLQVMGGAENNLPEALPFSACHTFAHFLGRREYKNSGDFLRAFNQCDFACNHGCYHGVVEGYFESLGLATADDMNQFLAEKIRGLCGRETDYAVPMRHEDCIHGLGHAAMFVTEHDIFRSLELCDFLSMKSEREECYGGVFMENTESATSGHPSIYIKADDPMYPCSVLEERYLDKCYYRQAAYFSRLSGKDRQRLINLCNSVPDDYRSACFRKMGADAAYENKQAYNNTNFDFIKSVCDLTPDGDFRFSCFAGAVDNLIYITGGDFSPPIEFCSILDLEQKKFCYERFGAGIKKWIRDSEKQKDVCGNLSEKQDVIWCLKGTNSSPDFLSYELRLIGEKEDLTDYIGSQLYICQNNGTGGCYDNAAALLLKQFSLNEILKAIDNREILKSVNEGTRHQFAHYLGRLTYRKFKDVSAAFNQCGEDYNQGCYHGTVEEYFLRLGVPSNLWLDKISDVCGKKDDYARPDIYFSCTHGLGHAFMLVTDDDLPGSLKLCDEFSPIPNNCYGGVFMQNIKGVTEGVHPARFIKEDDLMYPCNMLEERYLRECYYRQAHYYVTVVADYDWQKVFSLCREVPAAYREPCFLRVGREATNFTDDVSIMKEICFKISENFFREQCIKGVIDDLMDEHRQDGEKFVFDFCSLVDAPDKRICYFALGNAILNHFGDEKKNFSICLRIPEKQFADWCLDGFAKWKLETR